MPSRYPTTPTNQHINFTNLDLTKNSDRSDKMFYLLAEDCSGDGHFAVSESRRPDAVPDPLNLPSVFRRTAFIVVMIVVMMVVMIFFIGIGAPGHDQDHQKQAELHLVSAVTIQILDLYVF